MSIVYVEDLPSRIAWFENTARTLRSMRDDPLYHTNFNGSMGCLSDQIEIDVKFFDVILSGMEGAAEMLTAMLEDNKARARRS